MASDSYLEYEDLLFEADDLIRNNRISEAVGLLEGVIAQAPDFGKAYNHLGWIYETKLKDFYTAEEMYKQCIAYNPDYPPVYLNLSIVLSSLEKYKELEDHLNKALKVAGVDKSSIHNEFGILRELQLDFNDAVRHFKDAIRYCLNDANLETYSKSIERCRKKREIL
ncbi:MAG: tetratricopeptide repeat protein [Bacteroidetes bacterium]|nr:tetratricopeptide repeat protein [Bacteroidota bacterium]